MRYDPTRQTMVTANPFQIRYEFQDGIWKSRKLPHERQNGQAEYRTPWERIQLLFKDLREFTGYQADLDPDKIETTEMTITLADGTDHNFAYRRLDPNRHHLAMDRPQDLQIPHDWDPQ